MFSNNDKISTRQVFRLFAFDFVGESTLVLPSVLASFSGNDGVFSILLGGILGSLYLWYLTKVLRGMDTDLVTYIRQHLPGWLGRIIFVFLIIQFIWMAGYGAYMFADVMKQGLIREESYTLILILVLLVAGYAVSGGIESRARVYEVLFWILFALLFLMLVVAARDVDIHYMKSFFSSSVPAVARGSLPVFFCLMPLFLILFFPAYVKKENWGKMTGATHGAVWFAIGVLAVLYVILVGSFGSASLATMRYPVITLMNGVHIRGSFLKRLDAFMIAIWFVTLFALLNVFLFYGQELLYFLLVGNKKNPARRQRLTLLASLVLIFLIAEWFYYGNLHEFFINYMYCVGMPLLLVLPAALLIFGKAGKKG